MPYTRRLQRAALASAVVLALAMSAPAAADTDNQPIPPAPTAPCDAYSPVAFPCVGTGKFADAVAAECRRLPVSDRWCLLPLAHRVTQSATDAYLQSWVHRTAQFQYALQDSSSLHNAQWLGTHNSYNSLTEGFTLSHADSNQQLSLTQQLNIDMRSIELDLHYVPRLWQFGARAVVVCHGLSPAQGNLGCTNEPTFAHVLPEIATWLNAHPDQVIMLYLEDALQDAAAYASAVATMASVLQRPNHTSLIYHPNPADKGPDGCVTLPLSVTRDQVRAAGAQVIIVSKCAPDWSADVFNWNPVEVESNRSSGYQPYPACDPNFNRTVYDTKIVRYYEDTTFVSSLADPTMPPINPNALSPSKVQSMTNCGVQMFGFDQILPEDGRIQASLWSWAPDEPRANAGSCTLQRADGHWVAAPCTDSHPAACLNGSTWSVTAPVTYAGAPAACTAGGSTFDLPLSGYQNSQLNAVDAAGGGAWIKHTI
ncbi:hypothetical protein [Mycobacterium gastri]|uniref:Uncharacterized protein n=1 Tax=Mycobacterium gastri TaxID=1777 RepID=A0A1X1VE58_MYCGS|nr:hypothetical protein [Mycobacterium gastri]ETW25505.1 hypothetical protein MGAST_02340 [Mycobacterium gastri 'Wayne']ORV67385.1 hypothetical protein AWC07_09260 [Mycobacterium gastri]